MSGIDARLDSIEKQLQSVAQLQHASMDCQNQLQDDMIDLKELWNALWQGKWWIIGITFLFAVGGVAFSLNLPNMYTSKGIYAPVQKQGANSLTGQLGGLAAIAGISLNDGEANDLNQALALITSWPFLEKLVNENNLAPYVLAVKRWDKNSEALSWNTERYDDKTEQWLERGKGKPAEPTSYEVYEKLSTLINASIDKKTGLVEISVTHYSPIIAQQWVKLLVNHINAHFQKRDIFESKRNIEYLETKINETSIADMQSVFYGMIESQIKTLMLAEAGTEYLLKEIVIPKVAERKSKPKRSLICILSIMLGGALSSLFVLVKYFKPR